MQLKKQRKMKKNKNQSMLRRKMKVIINTYKKNNKRIFKKCKM